MDLSNQKLSKLPHNLPKISNDSFDCSKNRLTSLNGSPQIVEGRFKCCNNKLTNLVGGPKFVQAENQLISLLGVPKITGGTFWSHQNDKLMDVSDIWESEIIHYCALNLNSKMAILPLVKFYVSFGVDVNDVLTNMFAKHRGSSKQNILDLQYDLIDNGYGEYAKWKPE